MAGWFGPRGDCGCEQDCDEFIPCDDIPCVADGGSGSTTTDTRLSVVISGLPTGVIFFDNFAGGYLAVNGIDFLHGTYILNKRLTTDDPVPCAFFIQEENITIPTVTAEEYRIDAVLPNGCPDIVTFQEDFELAFAKYSMSYQPALVTDVSFQFNLRFLPTDPFSPAVYNISIIFNNSGGASNVRCNGGDMIMNRTAFVESSSNTACSGAVALSNTSTYDFLP